MPHSLKPFTVADFSFLLLLFLNCNLTTAESVKFVEIEVFELTFVTTKPLNMKLFSLVAAITVLLFSSCDEITGERIRGNGNVISQARSQTNFTGVEVSDAIHVYVKTDSAFSVKVEADENLQQHIIITEVNGVLRIREEDGTNLNATGKIKVYVSAPSIKSLDASGASKIISENELTTDAIDIDVTGASSAELELKTPKVSASMSGASHITLFGKTKDLIIKGSGASDANCYELLSENADVDLSGASNAEVFASVKLNAEASGASDVRYKGSAVASQRTSGAGSVKKVE